MCDSIGCIIALQHLMNFNTKQWNTNTNTGTKNKIQSDVFHSVAWLLHLVLFVVLCYRGVYTCMCVCVWPHWVFHLQHSSQCIDPSKQQAVKKWNHEAPVPLLLLRGDTGAFAAALRIKFGPQKIPRLVWSIQLDCLFYDAPSTLM